MSTMTAAPATTPIPGRLHPSPAGHRGDRARDSAPARPPGSATVAGRCSSSPQRAAFRDWEGRPLFFPVTDGLRSRVDGALC